MLLTPREREIMTTALRRLPPTLYSNAYVSTPEAFDWIVLEGLCDRGLMYVRTKPRVHTGDLTVFAVTLTGLVALGR